MGQDFTLSQTEVTFDLGANDGTSMTVFVDVLDDLLVEETENIVLSGSVAAPASFVGGPATVRILDDDSKCVYAGSLMKFSNSTCVCVYSR